MSNQRVSALGLDLGSKRIGVAGCDGLGLLATELTTIKRKSFQQDVEQLKALVKEREVQLLVIGMPYSLNGEVGFQAKSTEKLAHRFAKALELPLEFVDERLTSCEAEEQLKAQKISLSRNKGLIDRKAAGIILQQWLEQRREKTKAPLPLVNQTTTN